MSAIDPEIDDQLQRSDQDVEANIGDGAKREHTQEWDKDEEEDLMDPSTWWFASTACPLVAGTFGPMANGFSICALVYCWRVYIPPGGTEQAGLRIPDPHWALAINGVSLACALIGNAALLVNMARRLRFSIAQPITIGGFFVAGILLIAIMAAFNSSHDYFITEPQAEPDNRHAFTSAYYYAGFAAGIYLIIAMLLCLTVYGAARGHYKKDFNLTPSQRTLMLQTMSWIAYLLLGALIFSYVENWNYLDGVYWADVTLLTIGLGDYSPETNVGRGLLFPYALGGVLIIGLVIGSIRSLVLERGRQKMSARIVEKRRETAVHNVDQKTQTIRISYLARVDFSTDPALSPAQRREEEFNVMRKVQKIADRERRYFSLAMSLVFVLLLWFIGALIFSYTEVDQGWTYFESLYFTFVVLITLGYGDFTPNSNSGRAFFVLWSLLAVPSLTILISNMGDTIVKGFSDLTIWVGSLTVLPGEQGVRVTLTKFVQAVVKQSKNSLTQLTPPGLLGIANRGPLQRADSTDHWSSILDRLANRLMVHVEDEEVRNIREASQGDEVQRDMHFYQYVLARECRNLQKNLDKSPPVQYTWGEWEYFLRLMGNRGGDEHYPGQQHPDAMAPSALQLHEPLFKFFDPSDNAAPVQDHDPHRDETPEGDDASKHIGWDDEPKQPDRTRSNGFSLSESTTMTSSFDKDGQNNATTTRGDHQPRRRHRHRQNHHRSRSRDNDVLRDWSWLSDESPLMSNKTESRWILERLSAALERELNRQRKGYKKKPPISMKDIERINVQMEHMKEQDAQKRGDADEEQDAFEKEKLANAARGRE